jgi:hypothetical protein
MNPELRRNLWLQFSPMRLVLAPITLGAIFALTRLVDGGGLSGVKIVAESIYDLLIVLWGTRRAADLVAEEIAGGTWDGQRMAALGAWQMSWGKLLGGTSYVWYCAGLALLVLIIAQWVDGTPPWDRLEALHILRLLGAGALALSVAMLVSLALLRRQGSRRRLGVTLSQIAGILAGFAASRHLHSGLFLATPDVLWYGRSWDGDDFTLLTLGVFLAWSIFGIYRLMRVELKFRSGPSAWFVFALFLMAYADGFLYEPIVTTNAGFGAWLILPFLLAVGLTYLAVFIEPKDVMRYRWLFAALARDDLRRGWSLLPLWVPVYGLTLLAAAVLAFTPDIGRLGHALLSGPLVSSEELQRAPEFSLFPLSMSIYLLRDVLLVLLCNFGRDKRRGDATAFIILFVVYVPLTGILSSLGLTSLIPVLAPYPLASPLLGLAVAALESAALAVLVYGRLARAGRFAPAAA